MPSTYSTSLKLELIGNGEQTGTWGQTTNNNLGTLIEQAITGVGQITLTGDTTLTNFNGLPDESRNAVLVFGGSLIGPANVTAPSVEKTYIITNNAGANVTVKTAGGTGVTVSNGLSALVYCDGTNFYTALNVNNVIGDLAVSGNEIIGGQINLGNSSISGAAGNLTMTANNSIIDMSVNTGALIPPTGTLAQRPATPSLGMTRWNSTNGVYEIWNGLAWQIVASGTYSIDYLIVAGGGGSYYGGGGGGGLLTTLGTAQLSVNPGTTYSFTVGAGGGVSTKGSNTTAFSLTAIGGGFGGNAGNGGSGGSGGGAGSAVASGGSGTSGQGNKGGDSAGPGFPAYTSAGGGGAGAAGGDNDGNTSGAGGNGLALAITGSSIYYAGGGGGGSGYGAAANGLGGGSTANRGGGAQGGGSGSSGGSGVVILSVPTTNYSGVTTGSPTITVNGAYTVLTFTTSGSYTA